MAIHRRADANSPNSRAGAAARRGFAAARRRPSAGGGGAAVPFAFPEARFAAPCFGASRGDAFGPFGVPACA